MREQAFLFNCDGCGTDDRDMAYICSACEFWIHKTCALLPITLPTNHHHHPLSLAFNFPIEHRKFVYKCEVCLKGLYTTYWVYCCGYCRYFAHVKCATPSEATKEMVLESNSNTKGNDGSDLIQLPALDISKDLITPFVIRENGFAKIPDTNVMPASITMPATTAIFSLFFNYHKHSLSLVSEGPTDHELMICDLCVTPIYSPPYYNCVACKYFLHSTCYFLPKTLCLDSQLYGDCLPTRQNHKLTTGYTASKLSNNSIFRSLCRVESNGMVYGCEGCNLSIDVKCASLPITVKHASHPQHKLSMRRLSKEDCRRSCDGCTFKFRDDAFVAYDCTSDGCDFPLELDCLLLPQRVKNERDKHPLLLTYDASIDHPADFYCEICEEEIQPKRWMYHCRECDGSFHTRCLAPSGFLRNIKFGRQVEFGRGFDPHPLTFNQVTLKLRCDICRKNVYRMPGFECASCNYVMCQLCGVLAYIMDF